MTYTPQYSIQRLEGCIFELLLVRRVSFPRAQTAADAFFHILDTYSRLVRSCQLRSEIHDGMDPIPFFLTIDV
jgi:hypothetical protein